jgi:hypothetical protein
MSYQIEFNFETPEQKEKRLKDWQKQESEIDKMFERDGDYYIYNKYIDKLLDILPYRLGWGFKNNWSELRWWVKCKYQTFRYGVSDDDVFSLENRIAEYIVPRLQYFKKKGKFGIPMKFLPSNYIYLEGEEKDKAEKIGEKEIDRILDEMIFAFDYIINPDKYVPFPESSTKWDLKDRNYFNREKTIEEKAVWDDYIKKCEICNTRKKQGLQLFAEHMDILWI